MTFAGLSSARELVEHHGLEFLPLDPSRYQEFLRADAGRGTLERLLDLGSRRRQAMESTQAGGFARAVRELDPDLVLINGEMHEHIIALSATGVPMAVLNTFVSIWRQPGLPPPTTSFGPAWGGRVPASAISLLWIELRLRKRLRAWCAGGSADRMRSSVGAASSGPRCGLRPPWRDGRQPVADPLHLPATPDAEPARAGVRVPAPSAGEGRATSARWCSSLGTDREPRPKTRRSLERDPRAPPPRRG